MIPDHTLAEELSRYFATTLPKDIGFTTYSSEYYNFKYDTLQSDIYDALLTAIDAPYLRAVDCCLSIEEASPELDAYLQSFKIERGDKHK